MSQKQNLLVFVIFIGLLAVLGLMMWSGNPDSLDSDTGPAAGSGHLDPTESALDQVGEELAEGLRLAGDESAGRSKVESPQPEPDAKSILLTGRLVHENRQPAADVALSFRPHARVDIDDLEDLQNFSPQEMERRMQEQAIATQTSLDGRFSIRIPVDEKGSVILSEESNRLFAEKEGRYHPVAGFTKDVDLGDMLLIPGATLAGRVMDPQGRGIEGVDVSMSGTAQFASMSGRRGNKTDEDGRFEFSSLRPGKHSVSVTAPGFVPATKPLELAKGESNQDFVIRLESGASIAGTVLSDEGKPIEGAKVASYRKREMAGNVSIRQFDDREAVETDENGYFVLAGIEADSVVLRAWSDGHGEQQIDDVQVGASGVVFHLARHGSMSGILVDSQGEPLAGSKVWIRLDRGIAGLELFEDLAQTRSAEDGSFTIEGVPAGEVLITADGDLHRPVDPQSVRMPAGGEVRDLRLVAETGAILEILVLDAEGEPIEGVEVKVNEYQEPENRSGGFVTRDVRAVSSGGGGSFIMEGGGSSLGRGTTDAAGRVRIAGLPEAMVSIEAEHESMIAPADGRAELSSSQVIEKVLTMKPGGFITVSTLDANGEARPETDFEINGPMIGGEAGGKESGKSNGEGLATIGPLAEGSYSAVLSHDTDVRYSPDGGVDIRIGGASSGTLRDSEQTVVVKAGETTELSLVRPILTHFSGILSDATGPVSGAKVSLVEEEGRSMPFGEGGLSAKTDRDGRFSIKDIQAGAYTLEYGRENALVKHEEEMVIPPAQAELSRDLMLRGGSLRVKVVDDQDGMPVERAKVALKKPGSGSGSGGGGRTMSVMMVSRSIGGGSSNTTVEMGGGATTVDTDEDGVAILEDIPPGEYILEIKHSRFADEKVEAVKIADGKVTEQAAVQMSPAGYIKGTVTGFGDEGGMRIAMVQLKQVGSDAEPSREPAMNGNFSFEGLRPGLYELSARRMGLRGNSEEWGPSETVEVVAGKRARPQLQLPPK